MNNRQTGQGVEFLDVFHQIEDDPIGFVTKKILQNQQQQDVRFYTETHTIRFISLKVSFLVKQ